MSHARDKRGKHLFRLWSIEAAKGLTLVRDVAITNQCRCGPQSHGHARILAARSLQRVSACADDTAAADTNQTVLLTTSVQQWLQRWTSTLDNQHGAPESAVLRRLLYFFLKSHPHSKQRSPVCTRRQCRSERRICDQQWSTSPPRKWRKNQFVCECILVKYLTGSYIDRNFPNSLACVGEHQCTRVRLLDGSHHAGHVLHCAHFVVGGHNGHEHLHPRVMHEYSHLMITIAAEGAGGPQADHRGWFYGGA